MTTQTIRRAPLITLLVGVSIIGCLVGGCFGALAGVQYSLDFGWADSGSPRMTAGLSVIGPWAGALSGLMAGLVWCRIMIRRSLGAPGQPQTVMGAFWGVVVGVMATVLLHAALMLVFKTADIGPMLVGLIFGLGAGAVTGLLCSYLCSGATDKAMGISLAKLPSVEPEGRDTDSADDELKAG